ncbi:MAG: hypothetical protein KBA06_02735 [Saprospiraceae bacterium]|nr:hypothetical protein [Saprospiraceae bacterium]
MRYTKLYLTLSYLDKLEIKKLNDFLSSPYFNKSKILYQLFTIIEPILLKNTEYDKIPDKQFFWKKIYKTEKYDDARFRKLCSDLYALVLDFVRQRGVDNDFIISNWATLKGLQNLDMKKMFAPVSSRIDDKMASLNKNSLDFYLLSYLVETEKYQMFEYDLNRTQKSNIEDINRNLDLYFYINKLIYLNKVNSQKKLMKIDYDLQNIDGVLDLINHTDYVHNPIIKILNTVIESINHPDEVMVFDKLVNLLKEYTPVLNRDDIEGYYTYCLNYCTEKGNKGNLEFWSKFIIIVKLMIANDLLLQNGKLSPWRYKNIVTVGLREKDFVFVEDFINTYKDFLDDDLRENAVTYNTALLRFYQKKYNKVIELLRDVEYEDISYNVGSKNMLLSVYYETDEIEPLYYLFESFRAFLNRNKELSVTVRTGYLNLIKFTKKLTKIKFGDASEIEKLENEINAAQGVMSKNWLLEKVKELKV